MDVPVGFRLVDVMPHMHYLGSRARMIVTYPDGRRQPIFGVEDWDLRWQNVYLLRTPLHIPAGSRLDAWFVWDNSGENFDNPFHPPRRIGWGWKSEDEMAEVWMGVLPDDPARRTELIEASYATWTNADSQPLPDDTLTRKEYTLNFAHFANGNSIASDVVLVNVGPTKIRPEIYFYDTEGAPVAAESVVDVKGDLSVAEDGALTVKREIPSLGELTISTSGQGEVVTGSVRVVARGPIGGVLRFNAAGIGVAGVGSSQPVQDAIFPARRQEGGINTGTAIRNLGEDSIVVSCQLMQGGTVLEETDIPLEGNGQIARFIQELFPETDTSNFVGSVRCTLPEGKMFTGVALEMDARNRIFTTLPVVPVPR